MEGLLVIQTYDAISALIRLHEELEPIRTNSDHWLRWLSSK